MKLNFSTIAISLEDIGTEKEKKGGKLEIGFDRKKKKRREVLDVLPLTSFFGYYTLKKVF